MNIEKIKVIVGSPVKKKAFSNGIWMYLLEIFNTIVPLLTLPYITRILGASQYGVFSIAINILGYFQVIVSYGFGMSATREIALSDKSNKKINRIFSTVFFSRFILLGFCVLASVVYALSLKSALIQVQCLIILLSSLIGSCLQLNWLFQGMQQMQYISIISMVSRTISVALIFMLVKSPDDLLTYCFLYSVSPIINGFLGIIIARVKFQIRFVYISKQDIIQELKKGWYVFTTQLSSKVFGAIGITFLGIFATKTEVGIYSAIQKIPNMMMLAWTPITQILYPISSKKLGVSFKQGRVFIKKIQKIIIPIFALGTLAIGILSKVIVYFAFGVEYAEHYYWILPLLVWFVLGIYNNFQGVQTLLGGGYDKEYSKCFQISVFCTIALNFVLIYFFKGTGACIAPALSEIILGFMLHRVVRKLEKKYNAEN